MSWIRKLYETYDNCQAEVGKENDESSAVLLPICHTTQQAQVEIVLDGDGNFLRAKVVSKEDARTIIPVTEGSGGRTSGLNPHPLNDKLQYIAGDYSKYGAKTSGYSDYLALLEDWCQSEFSHPKAKAILNYVRKGYVFRDLISYGVLFVDKNKKLLSKWEDKNVESPPIFSVITGKQEDAFIRWMVEIRGEPESKVWKDESIWNSWIGYYLASKKEKQFCFVKGEFANSSVMHMAKIRNEGDKAKLISSNDTSNFTFRGRFSEADQAASLGFEASQKAHLALRWLIAKQGYRKDSLAVVAWATSGDEVPALMEDSFSFIWADNLPSDQNSPANTAEVFARRLKRKIAGYGSFLGSDKDIIILGVDSATPGRLSIIYYRELTGSEFLERIQSWHESCSWVHRYRSVEEIDPNTGKNKRVVKPFTGAPSPNDIVEAAFGSRVDENLRKLTLKRLLPCLIDGQPIPRDIVESCVRRVSNRVALDNWEWEKYLSIACALYKKQNQKEVYTMALDTERKSRDYLYGRLLAVAENIELWALGESNESRPTNALRLMQKFSERPYSTWRTLELALTPYKVRLGNKIAGRQKLMDEIMDAFLPEDFTSDKKLSGEFLLGYHSQRSALYQKNGSNEELNLSNLEE